MPGRDDAPRRRAGGERVSTGPAAGPGRSGRHGELWLALRFETCRATPHPQPRPRPRPPATASSRARETTPVNAGSLQTGGGGTRPVRQRGAGSRSDGSAGLGRRESVGVAPQCGTIRRISRGEVTRAGAGLRDGGRLTQPPPPGSRRGAPARRARRDAAGAARRRRRRLAPPPLLGREREAAGRRPVRPDEADRPLDRRRPRPRGRRGGARRRAGAGGHRRGRARRPRLRAAAPRAPPLAPRQRPPQPARRRGRPPRRQAGAVPEGDALDGILGDIRPVVGDRPPGRPGWVGPAACRRRCPPTPPLHR